MLSLCLRCGATEGAGGDGKGGEQAMEEARVQERVHGRCTKDYDKSMNVIAIICK